jgi:hypothetical protein
MFRFVLGSVAAIEGVPFFRNVSGSGSCLQFIKALLRLFAEQT